MSDREALARLIDPGAWELPRSRSSEAFTRQRSAQNTADRILAAGWRPSQPAPAEPCRHPLAIRRRQYSGIYCGECGAGPLLEATIQPAPADEAVTKTARDIVARWLARGDDYPPALVDAIRVALLAERAAREAAERERDEFQAAMVESFLIAGLRAALAPAAPEAADGR